MYLNIRGGHNMKNLILMLVAAGFALTGYSEDYTVENVHEFTNAFTKLTAGDTTGVRILLKPGIYDLTGIQVGTRNSHHLVLEKKMKNGLIAGTGSDRGQTIIKGGGKGIFYIWNTDANMPTVISNLTLTGGSTTGNGGAVFGSYSTYGCNLMLKDCIISNNYAKGDNGGGGGGAIHVKAYDCLFASNTCGEQHGGALLFYDMQNGGAWNCVFSNNTVQASGKMGGAVYIHNKSVLHSKGGAISNCTFIGNSSANSGGAFYASSTNSDWYAICQDCRFYENCAAYGGGASATGNTILTNCVFQGNTATQYGGGLRLLGNALCDDCTLVSNVAPKGAGLYISGSALCKDSVLTGNAAPQGSGAYILDNAAVSGCKFVRNGKTDATSSVSPNYGGGVYLASGSCIGCDLIENFCDNGGGAYVTSTSAEIRDCLFERNRQTGWNSGAAILVKSSTPLALVSNCVFNANIANNWSSRTIISNAELVDCVISNHCLNGYLLAGCNMTRCLVSDNIVYGNGLNLDIDTVYGKTEVFRTNVNCIVVGNVASNGANSITFGKPVINCTYCGNTIKDAGSGANIIRNGDVAIPVYNSILVQNRLSSTHTDVSKNSQPYLTNCLYSVAGSGVAAGRFFNCRLVTNFKFYPTEDGGEYDIKSSSPAFNAGMIEDWMLPLLEGKDFAGRERIKYDTIDIGALECQYRPFFGIVVR